MPARDPETKILKASDARAHLSELLNEVFRGQSRILVERSGIPVAAIISAADFERLQKFQTDEKKTLERMRSALSDHTEEQIVENVAGVVDEVRAEDRLREERFKALDATRAAFADVPDEELEQEITRAVEEARRRLRTKQ